jgi:hypothetical protein
MNDVYQTSSYKLKVKWDAIADDGGSDILSYSLELDDGTGGDFTPIVGYVSDYLLLEYLIKNGINKATVYRLRYRSRNIIGWSDYSPIAYILAANVPAAPLTPSFINSTAKTVTLNLPRTIDDGGSPILRYKLWVDSGDNFGS